MSNWIAVDWADEGARTWVLNDEMKVVAERSGGRGALGLAGAGFEPVLGAMIAEFLDDERTTEILIAGTPSLLGRLSALAPMPTPCAPLDPAGPERVEMRDERMQVRLLRGIVQESPAGLLLADGVRVAGFLAANEGFDGVICLPGAQTHWVHVSAGEIVSFQSFLTARIAGATLAVSGVPAESGSASEAFHAELEDVMARPQTLAQKIGSNEAQFRMGQLTEEGLRDRVSGALLGLELSASRPYWLGQRVVVVGSGDIAGLYRAAMDRQGLFPETFDATTATLNGFIAARNSL